MWRRASTGWSGSERSKESELADGRLLPAEVVVVGIGARPTTAWLADSGLELAPGHRGVVCDAAGATNRPGIVAVGDCSAWYDEDFGGPHRVEHWTSAHERGPLAAATLLGNDPPEHPRRPRAVLLVRPVRPADPVRRHGPTR